LRETVYRSGLDSDTAGASAGQLTLLIIAGLVAVSATVGAIRFYLNRHLVRARLRLPDIAA
jgi:hypothetical protein